MPLAGFSIYSSMAYSRNFSRAINHCSLDWLNSSPQLDFHFYLLFFLTFTQNVPRYEMAREQEETACSVLWKEGGGLASPPEAPTELCLGPRLCRTGKTGLVKSSSSFQG